MDNPSTEHKHDDKTKSAHENYDQKRRLSSDEKHSLWESESSQSSFYPDSSINANGRRERKSVSFDQDEVGSNYPDFDSSQNQTSKGASAFSNKSKEEKEKYIQDKLRQEKEKIKRQIQRIDLRYAITDSSDDDNDEEGEGDEEEEEDNENNNNEE